GQTNVSGPIDRGSILVSGSASISHVDAEGASSTSLSIFPDLLFFVAPKLAVDGVAGAAYTTTDDTRSVSWSVGPAVRLFLAEVNARTLPFVGADVTWTESRNRFDPTASSLDSSHWNIEGSAGITRMLSRQVGITGTAFVNRSFNRFTVAPQPATESHATQYGVRFGFSAFLF